MNAEDWEDTHLTLSTRLEGALALLGAVEQYQAGQVSFGGDVAAAAMTRGDVARGDRLEMLLLAQDGEGVELLCPDTALRQSIPRGLLKPELSKFLWTACRLKPHGHFVWQNRKLWWEPIYQGMDETPFIDLGATPSSPISCLFHSEEKPLHTRFNERPPPGLPPPSDLASEGSSFFQHVPLFSPFSPGTEVEPRFPIFSGPLTLILLLGEIFHPDRRADPENHGRGALDKHWFAVKLLLSTRERAVKNHHLSEDWTGFQRGVFNKVEPQVFERISKMVSRLEGAGRYQKQLVDWELDLLEKHGDRRVRSEAELREMEKGWKEVFRQLDLILYNGKDHHILRSDSPPPPHIQQRYQPQTAHHPVVHPPGQRQRVNVGGGAGRRTRGPPQAATHERIAAAHGVSLPPAGEGPATQPAVSVGGGGRRRRRGPPQVATPESIARQHGAPSQPQEAPVGRRVFAVHPDELAEARRQAEYLQ
ncbi:hypothetical protein JCM10213_000321 [Rhodosporidiobolus nylandii]